MPNQDHDSVDFPRLKVLAERFHDRDYRHGYVETQLRAFLADQIRGLRGSMSQAEFGRLIGKPQSVISRLEDEDYGRVSIQTLLDIAQKLDIAVLARFVGFEDFLNATRDQSTRAVVPTPYEAARVDSFVQGASASLRGGSAEAERGAFRGGGVLGGLFASAANANAVLAHEMKPSDFVDQYARKEEGRDGNERSTGIDNAQYQLDAFG